MNQEAKEYKNHSNTTSREPRWLQSIKSIHLFLQIYGLLKPFISLNAKLSKANPARIISQVACAKRPRSARQPDQHTEIKASRVRAFPQKQELRR